MPTPKKNTFYGATIDKSIVSTYYLNSNYPNFDRFVFQQMIDDGTKANDDYILIVYAVNTNGSIIKSISPIPTTVSIPAKKNKVNFANMNLNKTDLKTLYPGGVVNSDITLTPIDYYGSTSYIYYQAETQDNKTLITYTTPLNPSPPA